MFIYNINTVGKCRSKIINPPFAKKNSDIIDSVAMSSEVQATYRTITINKLSVIFNYVVL